MCLESPISRTPVVPKVPLLFDFRPGPKPTSARPYLLVHLPTLECSSEGIPMHLGTKYDHKDFLEEISFLKTWTSKPSS
ncbi:hypothetical protein HMI55_001820 [Coelomomyces lativittatus]|nr:hypothetical protein HMI55_001820 [Coelomomyces lativittatus]